MSDQNNSNQAVNQVKPINISDELQNSYLDYAMSVIMGRALPDARDGFKPVHRRVIYAMHVDGITPDKAHVKSAEIVGKVMGLFHPHGDSAIYNTLVRMAQDFSLRYPLVNGQGNFGGRGDESPAAMRYTEARMTKIALELVSDIDKETVDFIPNYSNKTVEPVVVPTRIPNLLINGSEGIAVGMATTIPPHNLSEVINGCLAYVDNPSISIDELMEYIPAPDFPTGCQILGKSGIREAYHTGKGKLYLRSKYEVKEDGRIKKINITEIPYQVSYNRIIERIHELIKNGEILGINEVLNLSKKDINIELRIHKDYDPDVIMNQLFAKTQLQSSINFNMVALNQGRPQTLNLKDFIKIFIDFRREVITRRCVYELNKGRNRAHILEALSVALSNIDEIIHLIRSKPDRKEAQEALMARGWDFAILSTMLEALNRDPSIARPEHLEEIYGINHSDNLYYFTAEQAKAILEMSLGRLTGLEQQTITSEYQKLVTEIVRLLDILNNPELLTNLLKEELREVKERHETKDNNYGARLSPISNEAISTDDESLINKEDVVITYTRDSYIKYQQLNEYHSQNRGGRGKQATQMKETDEIDQVIVGTTTDTLLCFTNLGRVFQIKVYKLPKASRNSRGRPINNFINLQEGESITKLIVLDEDAKDNMENKYLFFATEKGKVKRTKLEAFANIRTNGLKAINLVQFTTDESEENEIDNENDDNNVDTDNVNENFNDNVSNMTSDRLASVQVVEDDDVVYVFSAKGRVNAYEVANVRVQGRTSQGVIGIKLNGDDDRIIAVIVNKANYEGELAVLTVTDKGYGKRTPFSAIPLRKGRTSQGVIAHKLGGRAGENLVSALEVSEKDQLVIMTNSGKLIRINADTVRLTLGRSSAGVRLLALSKEEEVAHVERIENGVEVEREDQEAARAQELADLEAQGLLPATEGSEAEAVEAGETEDKSEAEDAEPADAEDSAENKE